MFWIRITALCKHFRVLPYAGGLMEQPGIVMLKMEKVIEAQNAYEEHQLEKQRHGIKRN